MSNKERIEEHNDSLRGIIDKAGALPDGGGGGVNVLNENGVIKREHLPAGYPYVEYVDGVVLEEYYYRAEEMQAILPNFPLVKDGTYTVTLNGTAYNCTCAEIEMDGVTVLALGNLALVGVEPTEEPFMLFATSALCAAYILDGSTSGTLSITGTTEKVTKMAASYMPIITVKAIVDYTSGTVATCSHNFMDAYMGIVVHEFHAVARVFFSADVGTFTQLDLVECCPEYISFAAKAKSGEFVSLTIHDDDTVTFMMS